MATNVDRRLAVAVMENESPMGAGRPGTAFWCATAFRESETSARRIDAGTRTEPAASLGAVLLSHSSRASLAG